jgi:hypothetical protein
VLIDCDRCVMRGVACDDCMVTVLLGTPAVEGAAERTPAASDSGRRSPAGETRRGSRGSVIPSPGISGLDGDFDLVEQRALAALADGGLIPPLRLVPAVRPDGTGLVPCDVAHDQPSMGGRGRVGAARKRPRNRRLAG